MRLIFPSLFFVSSISAITALGLTHASVFTPVKDDSLFIRKSHYTIVASDSTHMIITIDDDSVRSRVLDTSRAFFKLETSSGAEIAFGNKDSNRIVPARATLIYAVDDTARPRLTDGKLLLLRVPEQEISLQGKAENGEAGAELLTLNGRYRLHSLPRWEEKIVGRHVAATGRLVIYPKKNEGQTDKALMNPIWILK